MDGTLIKSDSNVLSATDVANSLPPLLLEISLVIAILSALLV